MTRRGIQQQCAGDACGGAVEGQRWFCSACFRRLPMDLKRELINFPPHLLAPVASEARRWLVEHRPATISDRLTGSG